MAYKVEINNPLFPKGTEFDVGGVLLKNGESVTIDAEMQARIEAAHGMTVKQVFGASEFVKITGSKEGGDS